MKHPACGLVDNTAHPKIFISVCDMGLVDIDTGDHLMTEQHLTLRVGIRHRAQGDRQAAQCLADAEGPAAITESALGLYFAQPETIGPDSTWMTHLGAANHAARGRIRT